MKVCVRKRTVAEPCAAAKATDCGTETRKKRKRRKHVDKDKKKKGFDRGEI